MTSAAEYQKATEDLRAMVADSKLRTVREARQLREVALKGIDAQRAYLRGHGSAYADSPDPLIVAGAFSGHVLDCLSALASQYEAEVSLNA